MAKPGIDRKKLKARQQIRRGQQGYILLSLILIVTLLTIAMAVAAQSLAFQIRRDREEELVHRGVQYSRAIRLYAKHTGLFPLRLEDLRDRPGLRCIRKLYKDPITGKDFKLIYEADIRNPQIRLASGAESNSGSAESDTTDPQPVPVADQQDVAAPTPSAPKDAPTTNTRTSSGPEKLLPRAGAIFGVVSASKLQTIREFNHKNHYNEWTFFYYPTYDRGQEIKGPTPLTPPVAPITNASDQPVRSSSTP